MFISYARIVLIGNINTYVFNQNQKVPREVAHWLTDDQGFLIMNIGCC
jgi:hypothetical protein